MLFGACAQVLPIPDEEVVQRIHQNFRVMFLKDALLRPMMDDTVVSTLNSLTYFNNTEILRRQEEERNAMPTCVNLGGNDI